MLRATAAALAAAAVAAQCRPRTSTTDIAGLPYDLTGDDCPTHDPAIAWDGKQYYLWATDAGNEAPYVRQWCSPDLKAWTVGGWAQGDRDVGGGVEG
jgi:hypothetical protein